ncbi:MAG: hypothetical protein LC105_11325 [Chitinophagales bacterium]|nr:hypothetical protein [Chitinophagales bacterium]
MINIQTKLKPFIYGVATFCIVSCSKEELLTPIKDKKKETAEALLSPEQQKRIQLNQRAAELMTKIVQNADVRKEIYESIRVVTQKNEWRDEAIYFKEILPDNRNTILNKPSIIALSLKNELGIASAKSSSLDTEVLLNELVENDIEFYFPYHEDFPEPDFFAVTYQDGINKYEKEGILYYEGIEKTVLVNDEYAMNNPTLVIGQFNNNRFAPAVINENQGGKMATTQNVNIGARNADFPIWINWGYVKAHEMHEGVLKGGPEFRFTSTDVNLINQDATAFPTSELHVNMTRPDVKNKRAKYQYVVLDQFWDLYEVNKRVHVYEDDRDGVMGSIKNILLPIQVQIPVLGVITVNAGKQISTKDEDLGHLQYNRLMFYASYNKNVSTYGHSLTPDSWPWLYHGAGIYYSLPRLFN